MFSFSKLPKSSPLLSCLYGVLLLGICVAPLFSALAETAPATEERKCLKWYEHLYASSSFRNMCKDCGEDEVAELVAPIEAARRELARLQAQVANPNGPCRDQLSPECVAIKNRIRELQDAISEAENHPWLREYFQCVQRKQGDKDDFIERCTEVGIDLAIAKCIENTPPALHQLLCSNRNIFEEGARIGCQIKLATEYLPTMCSYYQAVEDQNRQCEEQYQRDMEECETYRMRWLCERAAYLVRRDCLAANPEGFPEGDPLNSLLFPEAEGSCEPNSEPSTTPSQPTPTPSNTPMPTSTPRATTTPRATSTPVQTSTRVQRTSTPSATTAVQILNPRVPLQIR